MRNKIEILHQGRLNQTPADELLASLGFEPNFYNQFLVAILHHCPLEPAENILSEMQLIHDEPEILENIRELERTFQAYDCSWEIPVRFETITYIENAIERTITPTEAQTLLANKGVSYLHILQIDRSNVIDWETMEMFLGHQPIN